MNISSSFVANSQSPVLIPPCVGSLYHPAIAAQSILGLNSPARNTRLNPSLSTRMPTPWKVITLVGMQFGRAKTRTATGAWNRRDAVEELVKHPRVVNIGRCQQIAQRNALSIHEKMVLRARFAFVRRVGARGFTPLFAGTVAESRQARLQSISPARPSLSKNNRWRRSQTLASCHSFSRRQQVMPLPQPISLGSISQGIPLRRTKRIPVRAARSDTRGLPPLGLGLSGGNNGAISSHNASSSMGLISCHRVTRTRFC